MSREWITGSILVGVVLVTALFWLWRRKRKVPKPGRQIHQALEQVQIQLEGVADTSTLRQLLIQADFGSSGIDRLADAIENRHHSREMQDGVRLISAVRDYYAEQLSAATALDWQRPEEGQRRVWMLVGVNGSGKTTTVAKLAHRWRTLEAAVAVGACDTFRAAAAEQLGIWSERTGFRLITGGERTDPAAVAHNTLNSAIARNESVVLLDTAGRLQADTNLMRELEKVHRVAEKANQQPLDEILLVLDANQGQNLRRQIEIFSEIVPVTGVILTKYDGTGRAGAAIDALAEKKVPIRGIGIGEGAEDFRDPDPGWILDRIFGKPS